MEIDGQVPYCVWFPPWPVPDESLVYFSENSNLDSFITLFSFSVVNHVRIHSYINTYSVANVVFMPVCMYFYISYSSSCNHPRQVQQWQLFISHVTKALNIKIAKEKCFWRYMFEVQSTCFVWLEFYCKVKTVYYLTTRWHWCLKVHVRFIKPLCWPHSYGVPGLPGR